MSSSPPVLSQDVANVTVVRSVDEAERALDALYAAERSFVAWDTETTGVDPTAESPVGRGKAICMTAYGGNSIDFGSGPYLFVDCLDGDRGADMVLLFQEYFEDPALFKVWHNYSFDRHVLANHGVRAAGFGGDTMHMARLVDTSRQRYSLEELCKDYLDPQFRKEPMTARFGKPRQLKNGSLSRDLVVPSTIELQRSPEYREQWIDYAVSDAELTHRLGETLAFELSQMKIHGVNAGGECLPSTLMELYEQHFVPFGDMLIDMERVGLKVDVSKLAQAQKAAEHDKELHEERFRAWASRCSPDARWMNVNSEKQKQQLLFAPFRKPNSSEVMPLDKTFAIEITGRMADAYRAEELNDTKDCAKQGIGTTSTDALENEKTQPAKRSRSSKLKADIVLRGQGLKPAELTAGGWPSVSGASLRKVAGKPRSDPPVYGSAEDPATCLAIDDIMEASAISTLLSSFIIPLQQQPDANGRIHASLNLNTETGRLSSRRPNLQNQPALEKDRYRIRDAFVCEPGNRLIVADYGQLELRLLAHITSCASMIDAFKAGGDFHSRTALTMYDHVASAVDRGDCLLEWRGDATRQNRPPAPLLKDMFPTERRRAKTLNFSIAYGKTAMGLSKDWGISVKEAKDTLALWYKERQEVKQWQEDCREFARSHGFVETILGRRRHLPGVNARDFKKRGHAERAAINAPLQGSAADLVMLAMIKLHQNATLQELRWRVVLQIHDEIILEGPEESAQVAQRIVEDVMLHPLDAPLRVGLTVEPRIAKSWFDGK